MAKKKRSHESPVAPPGFTHRADCRGHTGPIKLIAWSPDGTTLASGAADGTIRLWNAGTGEELRQLGERSGKVVSVAWSPDSGKLVVGREDTGSTIELWSTASGELDNWVSWEVSDTTWGSIAWSPTGRFIASTDARRLTVRDADTLQPLTEWRHGGHGVEAVVWAPAGYSLSYASGKEVFTLNTDSQDPIPMLRSVNARPVCTLAWSSDGRLIAEAGDGDDIRIREPDVADGIHLLLEGSFGKVEHVAFSPDGQLFAARTTDGKVRLWRTDDWTQVAALLASSSRYWITAFAFHPTEPALATLDDLDKTIRIWDLDVDALLGQPPSESAVRYQNAKVVLVGDTGVGKSGLAGVLAGKDFELTDSTHGRRVLTFEHTEVPANGRGAVSRETLLWDLAGQPGYRLVHQLQMDDAAIALVLFDARSETDPFGASAYWSQALSQARTETVFFKYLIAARTDRGGVGVSQARIDEFVRTHGFDGFFRTSAKLGEGIDQLAQAIRDSIAWEDLPVVNSTKVFTDVRAFIKTLLTRPDPEILQTMADLFTAYKSESASDVTESDFDACIRRLEATDVVDILVFTALNEQADATDYVLLESAYVDAYASAIIIAAKDEPDGIGHLPERDVLQGKFRMDDGERLPNREDERLVLVPTIETFIKHEIALRERVKGEDYLLFPSQYTRDAPFPGTQSYGISYEFTGPIRNIFLTLVVRLAHSTDFSESDFWRDAARYDSKDGGRCIVLFEDLQDGRGRMTVFFEDDPPEAVRRSFLEYVFAHLKEKSVRGSVTRKRAYHCPSCNYLMDDTIVEYRLTKGRPDITCPKCDTQSPLYDLLFKDEPVSDEVAQQVDRIDEDARSAKSRDLAIAAIEGKTLTGEYDVFLSYNSADRAHVVSIARQLKAVGLRPWLDLWDLIPGRPWQEELKGAIERIKSVAVFIGPNGLGPWENREMRAFIQGFVDRDARVMPVLLPGVEEIPKTLPVFLRLFSWVDLRKISPTNVDDLKYLVAGIIDRRPDEQLWKSLEKALLDQGKARATTPAPVITLTLDHDKLTELEREAVSAQLAEQLGIPNTSLKIREVLPGSVRMKLEFDDVDELARLFKMIQHRDPKIIERFERWKANPDQFREENDSVARQVTINVGDGSHGTNIAVGEHITQDASHTEQTVDILEQLTKLCEAISAIELGPTDSGAVERALAYAQEEAAAEEPDRSMVAGAVGKAVKVINASGTLAKNVTALKTAADAIAVWCAPHAAPILSLFG